MTPTSSTSPAKQGNLTKSASNNSITYNKENFNTNTTNRKKLFPTYRNQNPASEITLINIITDNSQNINPNTTNHIS
jgi:hypothetical protein